jgi:coenzyme F420-dependent glucose-6-phosphate dehydrogenase
MQLGFALSSEDHPPNEVVRQAALAEEAGFDFCMISDHYHPWVDARGESRSCGRRSAGSRSRRRRSVWGTGVTSHIIRIHPAIVPQAAATIAAMMPGRFFLGVGTGENLNEHVVGNRRPLPDERLRERHYVVDHARVYTLPDEPPEVYVAATPKAAELAGKIGDGLISNVYMHQIGDNQDEFADFARTELMPTL